MKEFLVGVITATTLAVGIHVVLRKRNVCEQENLVDLLRDDQSKKTSLKMLKEEQLSRNISFFGRAGQQRIEQSFIVVVGLGGVGSHAANLISRSGTGRIRLIDFDLVTLSSLNRHACAVRSDVGLMKVDVVGNYIKSFAPWCQVESIQKMFRLSSAKELLLGPEGEKPDYVLDCIDDKTTKIDLLQSCCELGIQVLTSTGAGAKSDPTRIHIVNLNDVIEDPLAGKIRMELKTRFKNRPHLLSQVRNIEAVYSSEKPPIKLLPLTEEQKKSSKPSEEFGAVPNFRIRILPVFGAIPAIFGMAMASRVCTNLSQTISYLPDSLPGMSVSTCERLRNRLRVRLQEKVENLEFLLDSDDVAYLISAWKRRCAITFERWKRGTIDIAPWRFTEPVCVTNVILVHKKVAEKLDCLFTQEEMPTAEVLGITEEHFHNIEERLELIKQHYPRRKTIESIMD
eukprot:snap_masked-scaffold_2-processed-gene-8.24-mRNA-1 protein AED:0.02 eAED:0.02 QI:0/-1/0/1/-1/1/1/0/454